MEVIQCFPLFFSVEEGKKVAYLVTLDEIKQVLHGFAKSKSPSPDGWVVELFLELFDLCGLELLSIVEGSRINGYVSGALNATFITLIPKVSNLVSFNNF